MELCGLRRSLNDPTRGIYRQAPSDIDFSLDTICNIQVSNKFFTMENASFVLQEVKKVVIEDRPKPELKDPHDVLVHVAQTGICGSDVSPSTLTVFLA